MPSKAAKQPDFIRRQYEFTAHLRDPQHVPAPGDIEDRRMAVYRELLYNNVQDFMANTYPVLREISGDKRWHAMIRDYFARHQARTPLFPQMPSEFLAYLQNERSAQDDDPAFLLELAHYEWLELALSITDEDIDWDGIDTEADWLTGVPVLSPLALPVSYGFAVHRISPDYQPTRADDIPTYLVVYRDRADEIGFMETNPASFRLLQLLQQNTNATTLQLLQQIAQEMQHPNPQIVIDGGIQTLDEFKQHDIVPGIKRN